MAYCIEFTKPVLLVFALLIQHCIIAGQFAHIDRSKHRILQPNLLLHFCQQIHKPSKHSPAAVLVILDKCALQFVTVAFIHLSARLLQVELQSLN
ncbi:hypothetical protein V1523DRAFT_410803, partial [Lipomyces doorenjongii]